MQKINMEFVKKNIKLPADARFHAPSLKFGSLATLRALEKAGVIEVENDVKEYFDSIFGQ